MFDDYRKFNKEINSLKRAKNAGLDLGVKAKIRQSLMQAIASETISARERYNSAERNLFMHRLKYIATTLAGLAIVGGTAFASNGAKPGDVLFPVRKVVEKAQIALTANEETKAQLQTNIVQQRIQDITEVPAEHQDEAKQEAQDETNNAINVLTKVQADLQAKGNSTAADAVAQNIARIKADAKDHQLKVEAEDQNEVNGQDQQDQNEQEQQSQNEQNDNQQNDHNQKGQLEQQDHAKVQINVNSHDQEGQGDTQDQNEQDQ